MVPADHNTSGSLLGTQSYHKAKQQHCPETRAAYIPTLPGGGGGRGGVGRGDWGGPQTITSANLSCYGPYTKLTVDTAILLHPK